MDRLRAQEDELRETPPADDLIAGYFQAQGWWEPRVASVTVEGQPDGNEQWEPDLPEFTD